MDYKTEERLVVNDFLIIKSADIKIKKINVLIGPQANGKSLLAKLVYFFKGISKDVVSSIRANEKQKDITDRISSEFESIFPRYSWEGTSFNINYSCDKLGISVEGKSNSRGKTILKFSFADELIKIFNKKKKSYLKKLEEVRNIKRQEPIKTEGRLAEINIFREMTKTLKEENKCFFSDVIFIPAARSFFANLQNNIFTFLAANLKLDPLLVEFGSLYENAKNIYSDSSFQRRELSSSPVLNMVNSIIQGKYEFHEEKDWIVNNDSRINLSNASSGQQESLPMLLVLSVWTKIGNKESSLFFIEEPEAHLFPTSQSTVVSLLSILKEDVGTGFFITTHSPYIITALNNLIMAMDAINEGKITKEGFQQINGYAEPISFEDVSAYTIHNGHSKNIADNEYRLIGGEMLDQISEHFETVMNNIIER